MVSLDGGEGGIRTLEPLLMVTRFPIVRARPTTRLLHWSPQYYTCIVIKNQVSISKIYRILLKNAFLCLASL